MNKQRVALLTTISVITCLGAGCNRPSKAVSIASAAREGCSNSMAINAAALARAAFPDSLPYVERSLGRNKFLLKNRWSLFDRNHDDRLTFDEFLDSEWAGYLSFAAANACVVSEEEYLSGFLGRRGEASSGWNVPGVERIYRKKYSEMDVDRKGYITKDDIRREAKAEFAFSDKYRNGYIVPSDLK